MIEYKIITSRNPDNVEQELQRYAKVGYAIVSFSTCSDYANCVTYTALLKLEAQV